MNIKTKLHIGAFFTIITAILVGLTLFLSSRQVNDALIEAGTVDKILQGVFQLDQVAGDYLLHHEERAAQQWKLRYQSLANLLETAESKSGGEKIIIERMQEDYKVIDHLFIRLVALYQSKNSGQESFAGYVDFQQMLAGQISVKSQSVFDAALGLKKTYHGEIINSQQKAALLVELLTVALILVIAATSVFLRKSIVGPIGQLQKGAEAVAGGNLDSRVDASSRDEIGQLSRTFNNMTSDLEKSYWALNREIEHRKEAQEALVESEERFRSITAAAQDAVLMIDDKGKLAYWNPAAQKIFGYSAEEVLGRDAHQLLGPRRYHAASEKGYAVFRETGTGPVVGKTLELEALRKDGSEFPVELSVSNVMLRGKWHAVGVLRDITERKRAEEELEIYRGHLEDLVNERTAELQGANGRLAEEISEHEQTEEALFRAREVAEGATRAKSDFLANMSHELRTPLNAVIGFSELLVDQLCGPLNEKQQGYIENILTSGEHLLSLIDDILDLSKVEAGKMELELGRFSLRGVLDSSLTLLREKALKHNIKLSLELEPEADVELEADQRKCKQILFNLLSNALKFSPDGASVAVQARKVSATEAQAGGDWVEISVADTGIGIKPEDMPKLFKEFPQLESPYTKQYEGTGLGLALTRKFVELHGGRIWAESEFGKGSRFTFALPLRHPVGKAG